MISVGVDALTMNQQRALIVYNSELKDIYGTDDLTFSTASQKFMGVDIQYASVDPKTLSGAEFKEASYYVSMMGGWEYDIQCYSIFVVEPSKGMKQLLGLIIKPNNTPKPYVELVDTANDSVPLSEGGQQLKNHQLYRPKTGLYVGSPIKGSFWQFPIKSSTHNRNFTSNLVMSGVLDLMAFDTRQNKNQKVSIDFVNNKQFYTTADLVIKGKLKTVRFEYNCLILSKNLMITEVNSIKNTQISQSKQITAKC